MNRKQVRTRIAEVAEEIKGQLNEWRLQAADTIAAEKATATKKRHGRFWVEGRGFKYVDDVEAHLRRLFRSFDLLDPPEGSSVFEIGPGNCFLLFMCRELRGCRMAGVDWKLEAEGAAANPGDKPLRGLGQYAHELFRRHFGLEDVVRHQIVRANQPVDFGGRYDTIVATHTAFNLGWEEDEYRYWLRDCHGHLNPDGRLMIALNKVKAAALAALPFLRPPQPTPGFKKLTLISRAALDEALAGSQRRAT